MAIDRFRFVSVARYTSPMPPTPIWAVTSYGPRRVPGCSGNGLGIIRRALWRLLVCPRRVRCLHSIVNDTVLHDQKTPCP
jgi:hypothetical protein